MAAQKHELETTFINLWVDAGAYELVVSISMSRTLRELRLDLTDVNHVLKTGEVVSSDMLEQRGLWTVRGRTVEDIPLELTIAVISSEYEVELLRIVKVKRR